MRTRLLHAPRVVRFAFALLMSALFALVLAGCGGGSSTSAIPGVNIINGSNGLGGSTIDPKGDGTSGFQGKITRTPDSPTSTVQAPLAGATVVASLSDGTFLGSATSDGSGNYKLPLVPGNFVLTAQNISATIIPVAPPQTYRVNLHAFTNVNISYYDTTKGH